MVKISKDNIKGLINTLKGVMPANYESMDRLVASVSYLQAVLDAPEPKEGEENGIHQSLLGRNRFGCPCR